MYYAVPPPQNQASQLGFFELTSGEPQKALGTWGPLLAEPEARIRLSTRLSDEERCVARLLAAGTMKA